MKKKTLASLLSVSLILGILSFKNPNGKGMAITGFILSIVGCLIGLMYTIAIFAGGSTFTRSYSSVSRSLSRSISRSRSMSISRSRSRARANNIIKVDGYVVSFD